MMVLSHCKYCDEATYTEDKNALECCCDECYKLLQHKEYQENLDQQEKRGF